MTQSDTLPFSDVESWAKHYVLSTDLRVKIAPPAVPERFNDLGSPERLSDPGRPAVFFRAPRRERTPKPEALIEPRFRARVLHTFFHHELQAAELMCWALLAFRDAELEFRKGLLRICLDEIRHMNLYREHIERLGFSLGEFGIRDWFWRRVPGCPDKISFVAVMGMGLEAANLEYAPVFAARFRAVGDEVGAEIQERVAKEELSHVAFGTKWFKQWTGGCDFRVWSEALPLPLSPAVLHGDPIATQTRLKAGMTEQFIADLLAYVPDEKGRTMPQEPET
jgi:uncharacterized ferritin-like protein (DUF455 family)